jgi:pimeloyl-ACP methyl ester carboxylesterase
VRIRQLLAAVLLGSAASVVPASAAPTIGTTFPAGFAVPVDHSLEVPVIGFGSADGKVRHTPVIFLHGNNDTPYPTTCNGSYGAPQAFAQYFLDHGYSPKELWGLGYQGDQCDLLTDETRRASQAHSTVANVPDLRAFVKAVLAFTGASQVDIVGHSLGTTLAREWMRQDHAYGVVRRLVGIDGPNHGIINCSPSPQNYYVTLGFTPGSPVCKEYGAADTPFLRRLNAGGETPGPTRYLTIVNADHSFVYISAQDGVLPAVPAEDRLGHPHDFSMSAHLTGAALIEMRDQGGHDMALQASHTGIVNSPAVWEATRKFLTARRA